MLPFLLLLSLASAGAMDQLHIRYEWKVLDLAFINGDQRNVEVEQQKFIPENNIPRGIEVYGDRLFFTIPRSGLGIPVTLAYVDLKDNSTSPKLHPYPSWEAIENPASTGSAIRIRADRCGRLWVLEQTPSDDGSPNYSLTIYDLKNDTTIRTHNFPKETLKLESQFSAIALEDANCDDVYAYIADLVKPAIVVYSWAKDESWRVTHHYFHPDPLACNFTAKGSTVSIAYGVEGLSISAPNADNYSTLYFHPLSSNSEFAVSTQYLRNASAADNNFNAFKLLGSRGPNAQSSISFLDPKTGVLFYSLVNLNAVACWRTSNKNYDMKNQGRIYMNSETMVYPSDIKVDQNNTLWILSIKQPVWAHAKLNFSEVNFRVFSAPVIEAISHTACDVTPRSDILDKFLGSAKNIPDSIKQMVKPKESSAGSFNPGFLMFLVSLFVSFG